MALSSKPKITPELEAMEEPWKQLKGEPEQLFAWFGIYLNLGINRSVLGAYREVHGEQAANPSQKWNDASLKYCWKYRGDKFDAMLEEAKTEATVDIVTQHRDSMHRLANEITQQTEKCIKERNFSDLEALQPFITVFFGAGGAGKFLTEAYKAIQGEKHNITTKEEQKIQWIT